MHVQRQSKKQRKGLQQLSAHQGLQESWQNWLVRCILAEFKASETRSPAARMVSSNVGSPTFKLNSEVDPGCFVIPFKDIVSSS